MAKRKKNARQWGGFLLSNVVSEGFYGLGGAPVLCRGGQGGSRGADRQVASQPRAACRSAAAYLFAMGVSAFEWDWVQAIDIIILRCIGEECVNTSNYPFASPRFNRSSGN